MTNKEALEKVEGYLTSYLPIGDYSEVEEIMAALEPEPSEDCINRGLAISTIKSMSNANPSYWNSGDMVEREDVFDIIDKYKVESADTEKRKPCINYEDGCEEWDGCPCVYYKTESELTNGDMIKAMFPNIDASVSGDGDVIDVYNLGMYCQTFDVEWWNTPYNTESED